MKKLTFCILVSLALVACQNPTSKEAESASLQSGAIEHIYKPTYTDNFKIGDKKNVLLAEQLHQAMFAKDFKQVGEFLADTAVFHMEDGSILRGKAAMLEHLEKNFSQVTIKNYKMHGAVPIVGENGHEWVLMFDEADVETPDGKSQKYTWMDSFRFEAGKIVRMNGFVKSPKE